MDENTLKLEISRFMAKLKADYTKSGKYQKADLDADLQDLNRLAFMHVVAKLTKLKPPAQKLQNEQQLGEYLKSFTEEQSQKAIETATEEVFGGYMQSLYENH